MNNNNWFVPCKAKDGRSCKKFKQCMRGEVKDKKSPFPIYWCKLNNFSLFMRKDNI